MTTVSPTTLKHYEAALVDFTSWMVKEGKNPTSACELDCVVVEFKNTTMLPRHKMSYLIASLEFFLPQLKRQLNWARRVSAGYLVHHEVKHTTPMTSPVTRLFGAHMCAINRPSLGFGNNLQQALGLRPGELLLLRKCHVIPPAFGGGKYIFRLGAFVSTKAKREQAAMLDPIEHPDIACVLEMLLETLEPQDFLVPYSYHVYNESLAGFSDRLLIDVVFTPHGARAGFATENIAMGKNPIAVKDAGRWTSESSFKTYLDVILAAQVSAMVSLIGLKPAMSFCAQHFTEYFSKEAFLAERRGHASKGVRKTPCEWRVGAPRICLARGDQAAKDKSNVAYKGLHSRSKDLKGGKGQGKCRQPPPQPQQQRASGGVQQQGRGKASGKGSGSAKLKPPRQR